MNQARSPRRSWIAPVAIAAIAVAMILVVVFGNSSSSPESEQNSGPVASEPEIDTSEISRIDMERRDEADPLAIGDVDAPATLVMYSDYQCTFCASWTDETLPTLLDYVDSGDLRIEWRDLAIFGDSSLDAAHGAWAAGSQGKYLEFTQALFDFGSISSSGDLSESSLIELAEELEMDVDQFSTDLTADSTIESVQENIDEAQELGVNSTPTFLLNGLPIVGAQPEEVFMQVLEQELAS